MSEYIRNKYTRISYELNGTVLVDNIPVEAGTDHAALVDERVNSVFELYPDVVVVTDTVYMNERVYVDMTMEPVTTGE